MIKLGNILTKIHLQEEEKAYHGTSHYFRCFRTAGIGGGQGSQMYGWGLYFDRTGDIAKGYQNVGTRAGKKQVLFSGKTPQELAFEYDNPVFEKLPSGLNTAEDFINYAEDMIEILSDEEDEEENISQYRRFINTITNFEIKTEDMAYVYEVILHKGKKPNQYEYMNWDDNNTPTSQVNKINNEAKKKGYEFILDESISPRDIYHFLSTYFKSNGSTNSPKSASLFLLDAGIDGNTHNNGDVRIIFDEKAIHIVNVCNVSKK